MSIKVSFVQYNSSIGFPFVALSKNKKSSFEIYKDNNQVYHLQCFKHDFYSYYLKRSTHFLEILDEEYLETDELYLTIFFLFKYQKQNDDLSMKYDIFINSNCSELECKKTSLFLKPDHIHFNENYYYNMLKGQLKFFFLNSSNADEKKTIFRINSQNTLIFLQNLEDKILGEEENINVFLNEMTVFFFKSSFNFPFSEICSQSSIDLQCLSFILFFPWNDINYYNQIEINTNSENENPGKQSENIIFTVGALGVAIIFLCLIFSVIHCVFHLKHRENNEHRHSIIYKNDTVFNEDIMDTFFSPKCCSQMKENIGQEYCCICLQEFKPEDMYRELYCFHIFHKSCIDSWIIIHKNCPICRRDYKVTDLENEKKVFLEKIKEIFNPYNSEKGLLSIVSH